MPNPLPRLTDNFAFFFLKAVSKGLKRDEDAWGVNPRTPGFFSGDRGLRGQASSKLSI